MTKTFLLTALAVFFFIGNTFSQDTKLEREYYDLYKTMIKSETQRTFDGLIYGYRKTFYKSGKLESIGTYKATLVPIKETVYFENGKVKKFTNRKDGNFKPYDSPELEGEQKEFDYYGGIYFIKESSMYKNGELVFLKKYFSPDKVDMEYYHNGNFKKFNNNGNLIGSGTISNGTCFGNWTFQNNEETVSVNYQTNNLTFYEIKKDENVIEKGSLVDDTTLKITSYDESTKNISKVEIKKINPDKNYIKQTLANTYFQPELYFNSLVERFSETREISHYNNNVLYVVEKFTSPKTTLYFKENGKKDYSLIEVDKDNEATIYKCSRFDDDGNLSEEGFFKDVKYKTNYVRVREWKLYNNKGEIEQVVHYDDKGKKDGAWIEYFDEKEKPVNSKDKASFYRKVNYTNGKVIDNNTITHFYLTGEKYKEIVVPKSATMTRGYYLLDDGSIPDFLAKSEVTIYYKDGKVKAKGLCENEITNYTGDWTFYNEDGTVKETKAF